MFLLIFPDVALIVFGFILSRRSGWSGEFWSGVEKLVYYWLFPALLFRSIVEQSVGLERAWPLVWCVVLVVLVAAAAAWLARPVLKPSAVRHASVVQCAFRFNSYVLLALSQRIGGTELAALAAVCVGVGVPLCNALAVSFLATHGTRGVLRELLRNPLIIATVTAGAFNALQIHLPEAVDTLFVRAGNAALALGLIAVGAGMRADEAQGDRLLLVWTTVIKLLLLPALALLLARLANLDPRAAAALLIFAAVPTASSCYILANRMGGDGRFVAAAVSLSTAAAVVTLPFWFRVSGLA